MNTYHLDIITKFYKDLEDPDLDVINKGMLIVHSLMGIQNIVNFLYIHWDSAFNTMGIILDKGKRFTGNYSTLIIILHKTRPNRITLKGDNNIIYSGDKLDLAQIIQFAKQYLVS